MTPRTYRPGAEITVAYRSKGTDTIKAVVGRVIADRYPDSVLAVDTDRGVLRFPWPVVVKVVTR